MSIVAPNEPRAAFTPDAWALAIIRNRDVKRSAEHVAWLLSSDVAFSTEGCTADDADIGARLCLAPISIKNALIILRACGFITWSLCKVDGARVRTIRPAFPQSETGLTGTKPLDDAPAPIAVAAPSPVGDTPRRRPRRSDTAVCPMPEQLSAQTDVPASPDHIAQEIACTLADCTQNGCDADPSPGEPEPNEDAADSTIEYDILRAFPDPPSSNGTHDGCDAGVVPQMATLRGSRKRYDRSVPLWVQATDVQHARAAFHAERLPWDPRCEHDSCRSPWIASICAESGAVFCAQHTGYADLPVALARFGLDRRR